jgi:hypothetical protein
MEGQVITWTLHYERFYIVFIRSNDLQRAKAKGQGAKGKGRRARGHVESGK